MEDKDIIKRYVAKFDFPPQVITTDLDNPIYIKLMKKALEENREITREEVEKEFSKVDYDLVYEDEELSASAYATKYSVE